MVTSLWLSPTTDHSWRYTAHIQQSKIVKYRPGMDNPADYCSRYPVSTGEPSRAEKVADEYINFIMENASPIAMNVEDIKRETLQDAELQKVAEAIHTGRWHKLLSNATRPNSPFKIYHQIRNELCTTPNRDIVLRGSRIVMPQSLRTEAIDLAHEGHQGLVKLKKLLRTKFGFRRSMQ